MLPCQSSSAFFKTPATLQAAGKPQLHLLSLLPAQQYVRGSCRTSPGLSFLGWSARSRSAPCSF